MKKLIKFPHSPYGFTMLTVNVFNSECPISKPAVSKWFIIVTCAYIYIIMYTYIYKHTCDLCIHLHNYIQLHIQTHKKHPTLCAYKSPNL